MSKIAVTLATWLWQLGSSITTSAIHWHCHRTGLWFTGEELTSSRSATVMWDWHHRPVLNICSCICSVIYVSRWGCEIHGIISQLIDDHWCSTSSSPLCTETHKSSQIISHMTHKLPPIIQYYITKNTVTALSLSNRNFTSYNLVNDNNLYVQF